MTNFDDIWQKYSKYSGTEFVRFSFHVFCCHFSSDVVFQSQLGSFFLPYPGHCTDFIGCKHL